MVIEPADRALRVSVIQRLAAGPRPAGAATDEGRLAFPLPDVAPPPRRVQPVEFVSGWRRPQMEHGVIIDAVPPFDAAELAYAFVVQPRGGSATVRWILPYGATDVEILVPERSIQASVPGLRDRGVITERGRRYLRWSSGSVRAGDAVTVRLDGLPLPDDDGWPEVTAAVLAVALTCGLFAAVRRRPRAVPA